MGMSLGDQILELLHIEFFLKQQIPLLRQLV